MARNSARRHSPGGRCYGRKVPGVLAASRLLVFGAGGHGIVVAEAAESMGTWETIEFLDDRYPKLHHAAHWPVVGTFASAGAKIDGEDSCVLAIGDNRARLELAETLVGNGGRLPVVVHKSEWTFDSACGQ